ncbi:MAG: 3-carboxy-cis,cis-muconate cycloisomerase [Acidobacteriota bacterium]|nr:3-carboxy-cis,cis-muconate cycloisomerase [Acidobacteriota bacterium]
MTLLDSLFRWDAVTKLFSDAACLQSMLDFEAALARAEAAAGVIPYSAATAIASKCRAEIFDLEKLVNPTALAGNLAIPLLQQLRDLVAAQDQEAANFVHWGATSQDAIDTGLALRLREAFRLIAADAHKLCGALAELADQHRATPIVGRTLMQHAVPTTLGTKFAGWLDALGRHRDRLHETRQRCIVLQFGGAVGTLATLGAHGETVAKNLSSELQLPLPQIPWHSHRDRMAEIATTLGLLTGTLGKIARDVSLHAQTEIAEFHEPAEEGRGGSSTMPHKRNPVASASIISAAIRVPGLVSAMLAAMPQEQERGLGGWHAEWETLPEIVCLAAGALHQLTYIAPKLELDVDRMSQNLEASKGLIFAEAVTAALGEKIPRSQARQLMDAALRLAVNEKLHLREALEQQKAIKQHLPPGDLDKLFDPRNYSGSASRNIDAVIATHKSRAHTK